MNDWPIVAENQHSTQHTYVGFIQGFIGDFRSNIGCLPNGYWGPGVVATESKF